LLNKNEADRERRNNYPIGSISIMARKKGFRELPEGTKISRRF